MKNKKLKHSTMPTSPIVWTWLSSEFSSPSELALCSSESEYSSYTWSLRSSPSDSDFFVLIPLFSSLLSLNCEFLEPDGPTFWTWSNKGISKTEDMGVLGPQPSWKSTGRKMKPHTPFCVHEGWSTCDKGRTKYRPKPHSHAEDNHGQWI